MKDSKKKLGVGFWVGIVFCLVFIAYIVMIALRAKIFPGDSLLRNMYEEDFAGNVWARLLKTGFIFAICYLIIQVSRYLVKLSKRELSK